MNKLLFACLYLSAVTCFAQPSFTAADLNPVIGEQFDITAVEYVNPGLAGANRTWDLSATINASGSDIYTASTVVSTGFGTTFPNANVALVPTQQPVLYFKTSSGALQYYGSSFSGVASAFSDPVDYLHYPVNYNDTYTDSYRASRIPSTYPAHSSGTVSVTVDGYGTLKTPAGTFTNVLRIYTLMQNTDSTYTGSSWIVENNNTETYDWYSKDNQYRLASMSTFSSSAVTNKFGEYLANAVGIYEREEVIRSLTLYPNPVSDHALLDISLNAKHRMEIRVYNTPGMLVKTINDIDAAAGDNRIRVDMAGLTQGIYLMELLADDMPVAEKRFAVLMH